MPMNYGGSSGAPRGLLNGRQSQISPQQQRPGMGGGMGGMARPQMNPGMGMAQTRPQMGQFGQMPQQGFQQRPQRLPQGMPQQSQFGLGQRPAAPRRPPMAQVDFMDPENGDVLEAIVKNWNRRNRELQQTNKKMQAASPLARPRPMKSIMETLFGGNQGPAAQWFQGR